jgi:hypothetical protein
MNLSREEISVEVDCLLDTCPPEYENRAFHYVLVALPWDLAFKHGKVRYSRLAEALARTSGV